MCIRDRYKGLNRENDQSYYYFMHDNLFDHINIPEENTHLPNGMEMDSEKECARYTKLIQSMGGVDLQLLGIGHNGHIGFNEPSESFDKEVHCVNLTQSTIEANKRFFASADDVPRQAYTMGIKTIMPVSYTHLDGLISSNSIFSSARFLEVACFDLEALAEKREIKSCNSLIFSSFFLFASFICFINNWLDSYQKS